MVSVPSLTSDGRHEGACGSSYRQVGRRDQAQAKLGTAANLYRAMEMTYRLVRAEAELGRIASTPQRMSYVARCIDSGRSRWDDAAQGGTAD
jgi:hypothetical protein